MPRFLILLSGIGLGFLLATTTTSVYIFSLDTSLEVGSVFLVTAFLIGSFLLMGLRDAVIRTNPIRQNDCSFEK